MRLSNRVAYRLGILLCIGSAIFFTSSGFVGVVTNRYWCALVFLLFAGASLYLLRDIWRARKGVEKDYEIRDGVLYDRNDLQQAPVRLSELHHTTYDPRSGYVTLFGSSGQALARIHIDNRISGYFIKIEDRTKYAEQVSGENGL